MANLTVLEAQIDSTGKQLIFTGDFRFRIEHDWNSTNAKGIQRENRSRLRYRSRFGLNYNLNKKSSFGFRFRTGNLDDQQGPHVTIGGNTGEFSLVRIGLEKLFYQYKSKHLTTWVGKNAFPLKKENELFLNNNVFPEGFALRLKKSFDKKLLNSLQFNTGHFIIQSNNKTFDQDAYLQVFQFATEHFNKKLNLFPALYYFNNINNFPDQKGSYTLTYSILHFGAKYKLLQKPNFSLGIEYYLNTQDYSQMDSIPRNLRNEREGLVITAKLGQLKKKGDWQFNLYYARLEKFSIVDYFAQNDWARWDYTSVNATGSRLSNFQGVEIRLGYAFEEQFNLVLRTYFVRQLEKEGSFLEDGDRIRLDLNIGF